MAEAFVILRQGQTSISHQPVVEKRCSGRSELVYLNNGRWQPNRTSTIGRRSRSPTIEARKVPPEWPDQRQTSIRPGCSSEHSSMRLAKPRLDPTQMGAVSCAASHRKDHSREPPDRDRCTMGVQAIP